MLTRRLVCASGHRQVDLGCARAAPQLRMLRRRSSARVDGGDDLHLISPDCDIVDMAVNSAEALPDDPMRARWARRAGRDTETLAETIARLQMTSSLIGQNSYLARTLAQLQGPGLVDMVKKQQAELAKNFPVSGITDFVKVQHPSIFGSVAENQTQPASAAPEASDQTPGADEAGPGVVAEGDTRLTPRTVTVLDVSKKRTYESLKVRVVDGAAICGTSLTSSDTMLAWTTLTVR